MKPQTPIIPGHDLPVTNFAESQAEYQTLPAFRQDDGTVLTRWRLSWKDFEHDGLKPEITRMFVCDHGFSSIEVISHGYHSLADSNKRMARPFADIHIVSVQPKADSEINHAVVMDKRGRVYDPDVPSIKSLTAYYYIVRVTGFWKD